MGDCSAIYTVPPSLSCHHQLGRRTLGRPEILERLQEVARTEILPALHGIVTSDPFRGCDLTSRALEGLFDVRLVCVPPCVGVVDVVGVWVCGWVWWV